jgi:tRNA threonylcarbamoyladenosine biosynthesis protein TsaE
MSAVITLFVADGQAMEALGRRLARSARRRGVIWLRGDLGTGKTTLVRGLLRGFGYQDKVRSPTYTLVEPYPLDGLNVYHLDLYRLGSPGELEWLGIRDLSGEDALLLIEWPERGEGELPPADLVIAIDYRDRGRELRLQAVTAQGERLMAACLSPGPAVLLTDE